MTSPDNDLRSRLDRRALGAHKALALCGVAICRFTVSESRRCAAGRWCRALHQRGSDQSSRLLQALAVQLDELGETLSRRIVTVLKMRQNFLQQRQRRAVAAQGRFPEICSCRRCSCVAASPCSESFARFMWATSASLWLIDPRSCTRSRWKLE